MGRAEVRVPDGVRATGVCVAHGVRATGVCVAHAPVPERRRLKNPRAVGASRFRLQAAVYMYV